MDGWDGNDSGGGCGCGIGIGQLQGFRISMENKKPEAGWLSPPKGAHRETTLLYMPSTKPGVALPLPPLYGWTNYFLTRSPTFAISKISS